MAWKHRTVAQEWQVVALTKDHPQRKIAQLTGLSTSVVLDIQRKYHLTLSFGRSISSAQFRDPWDEHTWGRVLEALYLEQRLSIEECARRCGVYRGTIKKRLVALGFPIRTAGEQNRGTKRGSYSWSWSTCANPSCNRGVRDPSETYCSQCRRLVRYRQS
jgi:hypothetical protein